jgi:multidrug efflux pump subunit AcrA (membrane-fusion protein)
MDEQATMAAADQLALTTRMAALEEKLVEANTAIATLELSLQELRDELAANKVDAQRNLEALQAQLDEDHRSLAQQAAKIESLEMQHEADLALHSGNTDALQASLNQQIAHWKGVASELEIQLKAEQERAKGDLSRMRTTITKQQEAIVNANQVMKSTLESKHRECVELETELKAEKASHVKTQQELGEVREKWRKELEFFRKKFMSKWQASSPVCETCSVTFTMVTQRRHHCRVCGQAFCSNCCSERVQTGSSKRKVRACHECSAFMSIVEQDLESMEAGLERLQDVKEIASATFVSYSDDEA